jgi:hypothetical protein
MARYWWHAETDEVLSTPDDEELFEQGCDEISREEFKAVLERQAHGDEPF